MKSMDENTVKVFDCDLNDNNLFSCILEEVGETDINVISATSRIPDKTFINCLNASLVNCLRNNRKELDFPSVQLQTIKKESGDWLIKQISISVNKKFDDDLIYQKINQCLKFVKRACKLDDSIQFSFIQPEIKENLKHYKVQLAEINQLLENIRDDESKKVKLFSLFRNISLKK
jgi:hypothetical protein